MRPHDAVSTLSLTRYSHLDQPSQHRLRPSRAHSPLELNARTGWTRSVECRKTEPRRVMGRLRARLNRTPHIRAPLNIFIPLLFVLSSATPPQLRFFPLDAKSSASLLAGPAGELDSGSTPKVFGR